MAYQGMFHSDESLRDYEDQYFNDMDDLYEDIEREDDDDTLSYDGYYDEEPYDDYVAELPENYDAV